MINSVTLVGRLVRDAEVRNTGSGKALASFTLAVDNLVKDANGQKTAIFIPCTAWDKLGETIAKFTHKGSQIGIVGRLNQRSYTSKDGKNVSVVEVVVNDMQLLDPRTSNQTQQSNAYDPSKQIIDPTQPSVNENVYEGNKRNISNIEVADDDLPF